MKNSTRRVLTAVIAAPVIVGLLYLGDWPFGLLVLAAALLIQWEVYEMMGHGGGRPRRVLGLLLGALLVLRILVPAVWPLVVLVVLLLIGLVPFEHKQEAPLVSMADTVFGAVYPTALLAFMLQIRVADLPAAAGEDRASFFLTLTIFLLIWASDVFAYYVGRAVGRHKLAPRVSPNKTWEGAAGGALGALLVAAALKVLVLGFLAWPHVLALGLICGALGQIGDLAESKLKRSVDLKDSGTILPGHGGLLDRFDAMIFAAPAAYLYLAYAARAFG